MTGKDIDYIKCQYREAADKSEIIGILSQQFLCTKYDIAELLNSYGFKIELIKDKEYYATMVEDIIYSGIVQQLENKAILKELKENGFIYSLTGLSSKRKNMCEKYPELLKYQKYREKWNDAELSWIREHYSEGENNILAKRFKNEVNPNRNLKSIRARIYAYAKKENLKKN